MELKYGEFAKGERIYIYIYNYLREVMMHKKILGVQFPWNNIWDRRTILT
jgi:hypothetical protein